MYCPTCGNSVGDDDLFCSSCGTRLNREAPASTAEDSVEPTPADAEAVPTSAEAAGNAGTVNPVGADRAANRTSAANAATSNMDAASSADQAPTTDERDANMDAATSAGATPSGNAGTASAFGTAPFGTAAAATTATASKAPMQQRIQAFYSGEKRQRRIMGTVIIAILAVILIISAATCTNEQRSLAEQAVRSSDKMTEGFVSADYTSDSAYEITSLTVASPKDLDQTSKHWAQALTGMQDVKSITCTGTLENDSFSTDFIADVYVGKNDKGRWELLMGPTFSSSTTTPKKGVEALTTSDFDGYNGGDISVSDFTSTLSDGTDGTYTCQASGTVVEDCWFGKISTKNQSTFVFKDGTGWTLSDTPVTSTPSVEWNLSGKQLNCTEEGTYTTTKSHITLGKVSGDTLTASYELTVTPDSDSNYKKVSLSGNLKGTLSYNERTHQCEVVLQDVDDKNITFDCTTGIETDSNRYLTHYTLEADVNTDKTYYEGFFGDEEYSDDLEYLIPVEEVDKNEDSSSTGSNNMTGTSGTTQA